MSPRAPNRATGPARPRSALSRTLGVVPLLVAVLLAGAHGEEGEKSFGLPLEGEEAEAFLRAARVTARRDIGKGITRPQRLTLTDGERTARAVWKTIDEHRAGQQRMERGWEFDFRDSWKNEVAAYELDKMLGLGLVPPTVERRIDNRVGSLQLWVEKAMTEDDCSKRKIDPATPLEVVRWNNQMHKVRFFHQLTYNTDFQNVRNVLCDESLRIYAVDSSRAFRIQTDLLAPDDLRLFSRTAVDRLRTLDRAVLEQKLGRWLGDMQIDGLLARRDAILAIVDKLAGEKGPGQVFFY